PGPRGVALAHHRPARPHPLPGRHGVPAAAAAGGGRARARGGAGGSAPARGGRVVIRVVVVDDSPFVRQALGRMFRDTADIELVATAVDGQDGLEKICALRPDVVTLDGKMPRMGGLEAMQRIMVECPTPVLLLSSLTSDGGEITLRGLELGAMDFVDKSSVQGAMNLLGL